MAKEGTTWLTLCKEGTTWLTLCKEGTTWLTLCKEGTTWLTLCREGTTWLTLGDGEVVSQHITAASVELQTPAFSPEQTGFSHTINQPQTADIKGPINFSGCTFGLQELSSHNG